MCTYSNVYILRCVHTPMCTYSNVYMLQCVHTPMCTCSNVTPMCTCSNVYILQCVHTPMCTYSNVYMLQCTAIANSRGTAIPNSGGAGGRRPTLRGVWGAKPPTARDPLYLYYIIYAPESLSRTKVRGKIIKVIKIRCFGFWHYMAAGRPGIA